MARHEAIAWVYMVASHSDAWRDKTILLTRSRTEAVAAANATEDGEVRIVYCAPVRGYPSNREHICGDAVILRRMESKRKGGAS